MLEANHSEKGPFVRDLRPEERFMGYYLLRRKRLEPFRDPSRGYFLTLIVSDRSGQILARVWEGAEEVDAELVQSEVVKIDGETEIYHDRTQIKVLRVRPASPKEYDIRDMLPSSKRDPQEMLDSLQTFIAQIDDIHLSALVDAFYKDQNFLRQFSQAPAARRIHHAYIHGLLEHTWEILTLAQSLIALYPQINRDLLFTGALLHDIGKLREYRWELDIDYTDEGRLLGHIVMTDEMVTGALSALPDFPPELAVQVRHMLISHHGRYEWGSPRRPKTLESIALHHIENLSAQVNRFQSLIESRPAGEDWTGFDLFLRRQLYTAGDDDLNIEERSWQQ